MSAVLAVCTCGASGTSKKTRNVSSLNQQETWTLFVAQIGVIMLYEAARTVFCLLCLHVQARPL